MKNITTHMHKQGTKNWLIDWARQGPINHSGAPYQRKAGALFSSGFSLGVLLREHFLPPKSWRPFFGSSLRLSLQWTFKFKGSNVKTVWKNLAVDRGPLAGGGFPMIQPAQWLIRPWSKVTSHQTHYTCKSYRGRAFTGQVTRPTVSKHWKKIGS